MTKNYHVLPTLSLPPTTDLIRLDQRPHSTITLDSPAMHVMTDFRLINPVTIHGDASLKDAHNLMTSHGIRLLFVENSHSQFLGLITATDLLGERPIQHMTEQNKHHAEVCVADVMTARKSLEALNLADVNKASVGQMVNTMKLLGRQHAIVVETNLQNGHYELCGLFSTSHMARLLGTPLSFIRVPQALSEIQQSLLHPN